MMRHLAFPVFMLSLLAVVGCGYRVAGQQPGGTVYLAPVQNGTDRSELGMAVEWALRRRLEARGFRLLAHRDGADRAVTVTLAVGESRTLQSGRDGRTTLRREPVTVTARIVAGDRSRTESARFSLLDRLPVRSDRYVNDQGETDRETADRMAQQVVAWLMSR